MSTVVLVPLARDAQDGLVDAAVAALWERAGLGRAFGRGDLTALKLHVGEPGTETHVSPAIAAALVRHITATGAQPFLTDTAVLYRSPRSTGAGHARVAHDHGFTLERVGAPFVPADGVDGSDDLEVTVDGRHFRTVAVASAIARSRSLLVLSHATGHLGIGFGGALKNLGMGCGSRRAKLHQHHGRQPRVAADRCTACGVCVEWCPEGAILLDEHAAIVADRCIGCGQCLAVCREGAVGFDWSVGGRELQERIVEHAAGVLHGKNGRVVFVTSAQAITKDCDCMGKRQRPLIGDIGLLASHDPVAIDQAALELFRRAAGASLESLSYPSIDASVQIRYAEALGLGSSRYELDTVELATRS